MKSIRRAPGSQGHGVVAWTTQRRVTAYLTPESFAKLQSRAEALEVGNGVVARQILEAWANDEPPPIIIAPGEHS